MAGWWTSESRMKVGITSSTIEIFQELVSHSTNTVRSAWPIGFRFFFIYGRTALISDLFPGSRRSVRALSQSCEHHRYCESVESYQWSIHFRHVCLVEVGNKGDESSKYHIPESMGIEFYGYLFIHVVGMSKTVPWKSTWLLEAWFGRGSTVDGCNPANQLLGTLTHDLSQGFIYMIYIPQWWAGLGWPSDAVNSKSLSWTVGRFGSFGAT